MPRALHPADFEGSAQKRNRHRLLFMVDEFPSLKRMEIFADALSYMAGYGLKAYLIIQLAIIAVGASAASAAPILIQSGDTGAGQTETCAKNSGTASTCVDVTPHPAWQPNDPNFTPGTTGDLELHADGPPAHLAEPSSLSDEAESYSGDGGNWTTQANVSRHDGEIVRPGPHAGWQRPGSRAHHPVSGDWSDPRRHRQQTCNIGRIRRETPR